MKKYLLAILVFCAMPVLMQAKDLVAYFNYAVMNIPDKSPYVEVYLKIPVSSLKLAPTDNKNYQAQANILLTISKGKDIVFFDKYILSSPLQKDTISTDISLLDLKRAKLEAGDYTVNVSIQDRNDTLQKAEISKPLTVAFPQASISFSDIILLDSTFSATTPGDFTRIGYNMLPSVMPYYNLDRKKLLFYTEIYNTKGVMLSKDFQLSYFIKNAQGKILEAFQKTKTKKPEVLVPVYDGFNITELPAGEYELIAEVRNENKNVLASKSVFFIKAGKNDFINSSKHLDLKFPYGITIKQIQDFMPFLGAISSKHEEDMINKLKQSKDTASVRNWFLKFWQDRNAENPEKAFLEYKALADYVNKTYKSEYTKGYKTDRGRMVLKYGKPDYISPYYDEPAAYPYEIWQYYTIPRQSNVKFIFYNPTQIEGDYMLLHSDAIGEVKNPQWKKFIYRRVNRDNNLDKNTSPTSPGNDLDRRYSE